MNADQLAEMICYRLYDLRVETTIEKVALDGTHVLVTASDGKVYRVTVEPWP